MAVDVLAFSRSSLPIWSVGGNLWTQTSTVFGKLGRCDKIALGDCLLRLEIARPAVLVSDCRE